MASPSDPSNQELARRRQQNMGRQFKFLIPLIYAPVLPLIRLTLRHKPVLRDRLFTGVLVGAFAHGFYLVYIRFGEQMKLPTILIKKSISLSNSSTAE